MGKIVQTTVLGIIKDGEAVIGADGQATLGHAVIKHSVKKVRKLKEWSILLGFAGSTADALTLQERLEHKLREHNGILRRSVVAFAKEWRTDKYLRRLEAMLIVMNNKEGFIVSGSGDVLEPDLPILAIGSGGNYAFAAAKALYENTKLSAKEIVEKSLHIAADICIYTNHNITIETL